MAIAWESNRKGGGRERRRPKQSDLFHAVFDASPVAMVVVDEDVAVQDYNKAAAMLGEGGQPILFKRGDDLLYCLHAYENPAGCGRAPA